MRLRSALQLVAAALLLQLLPACRCVDPGTRSSPNVSVRPAPLLQFRGANSKAPGEPGECDCNSPAHWDGGALYLFNSAGHPWRVSGANIFNMTGDYRPCTYNNQVAGGRWIECTWKSSDGVLYGWYHFEPSGLCPGSHPKSPQLHLTAPKIGAAKSTDNGATWIDLGVVLEADPNLKCDTQNYYFAGGNGDFCIMLDQDERWLYFFISTYPIDVKEQGVALARMAWKDRDAPAGKVSKLHRGKWAEPGIGGHVAPIFPAVTDWHRSDADAFWGPSVHWNTHLQQYVMLLNRTKDANWTQEGVYISYNRDLSNPTGWTTPVKIMEATGPDRWYPQVMGTHPGETDKLAGRVARLFIRGTSRWELVFQ